MTSKHFSEYQKRFFGGFYPYKTCYLENALFAIFGHSDLVWPIWNFDPQKTSPKRGAQKIAILTFFQKFGAVKSTCDLCSGHMGTQNAQGHHIFHFWYFLDFSDFICPCYSPCNAIFCLFHNFGGQKVPPRKTQNTIRVSKNHENLKIEFIHFYVSQSHPESDANLKKMFCAWIMGVSTTFWQLFGAFWCQKHVFWRIFHVFWRFWKVSIIGQREQGLQQCTRTQKNQNRQKWA